MIKRISQFINNTPILAPRNNSIPIEQSKSLTSSKNPFSNSPFINQKDYTFGKNQPSSSGYFAGYYNGKPNIVGKRLFIEA